METKEPRVWSRRSTCRRVREREFLHEIGDPLLAFSRGMPKFRGAG